MAVQAQLHDGTVLQFPDGTDPAVIDKVVKSHVSGTAQPAPAAAAKPSYGATDEAASNFTFGLSDKVGALGTAAGSALRGVFTGKSGPTYAEALQAQNAAKSDYEAANPNATHALSALGILAGRPGATALSAVRAGIVSGAAAGGAEAAGQSHGDVGDQAAQIALGAGLGAATGGVLAKVVPASINAVSRLRPGAAAARAVPLVAATGDDQLRGKAQQVITRALAADGTTPLAAGQQIADAAGRGVPLSLADTGDNVRGLAASVSRAPGPSRTIMRDAMIARQEGQTERVQGAITRDLGPTVGTATEAQRLEESAAAAAAPLYEQAHPQVVDDPAINKLLQHPEMQSALSAGKQMHADDRFLADVNGTTPPLPLPDQGVDVRTLDYAKRALDRKIEGAYSGDAQSKMQLPILKGLRSTLLTKLDAASPDYAAARAAYAGPMQSAEALAAGKSALSKSGDEIAAETSKMGPGELDQYRLGFRSALSDRVDASGDYADSVHSLVGSPKKRAALDGLFGQQGGLDNFLKTLADERAAGLTFKAVATGSPTANRLADDGHTAGETALGIVGKAGLRSAYMGPIHNAVHIVRDIIHAGASKSEQELRAQISAALSETDPAAITAMMRQARRESAIAARRATAQAPIRAAAAGYAGRIAGSSVGGLGQ